jgi:hypothetical protein
MREQIPVHERDVCELGGSRSGNGITVVDVGGAHRESVQGRPEIEPLLRKKGRDIRLARGHARERDLDLGQGIR